MTIRALLPLLLFASLFVTACSSADQDDARTREVMQQEERRQDYQPEMPGN